MRPEEGGRMVLALGEGLEPPRCALDSALLYHLSYPRICCGRRTRTSDLVVMGHTSYRLLYPAMFSTTKIDILFYFAKISCILDKMFIFVGHLLYSILIL